MASYVLLKVDLGKNPSITSEAGFYCMEYIVSKLTKLNLHGYVKKSDDRTVPQEYQKIARRIQEVGGILEYFYPQLFSYNITDQFESQLNSQTSVCNLFKLFTKELFKTDINWSHIVVLFVFAGALSIDCIQANKPEFIRTIIYCVKKYVDDHLVEWISDNGGWGQINTEFNNLDMKPKRWFWIFADSIKEMAEEKYACFWKKALALWS